MKTYWCLSLILFASLNAHAAESTVHLYPGYISTIRCTGRLLISAVGNDRLIKLESFPAEMGCGVLLKPLETQGRTNLLLETSSGTNELILEIRAGSGSPRSKDLSHNLPGGGA